MEIFPHLDEKEVKADTLSIQAFGKRFVSNQSLYEYLLEFLLVFSSEKVRGNSATKLRFHDVELDCSDPVKYYVHYRIALKRFILFEKSKREGQFYGDKLAYDSMLELIDSKIQQYDYDGHIRENIQDLFYGYSLVLKNRSWFAQSLLPLSPSLIFGESMGEKEKRVKIENREITKEDFPILDTKFNFTKHSFYARGGEAYYLHVLRSVLLHPQYKESIENGLNRLLTETKGVTALANFIQDTWEKENNIEKHVREMACGYIPLGYDERALYTCTELKNFLESSFNVIDKIQILAKGIILQIIRMFHIQARNRVLNENTPYWIIDMRSGNRNIRDFAEKTYLQYNEDIIQALNKGIEDRESFEAIRERLLTLARNERKRKVLNDDKELSRLLLNEGGDESYKVMKKLGKEIKLIIPANGNFERFSLSEDLVKFLVIALIEPGQKVTLEGFMQLLFEHYGMIIGSKHMHQFCRETGIDESEAAYFNENEMAFKQFLTNCGFLRELSDATSIVFNPYEKE